MQSFMHSWEPTECQGIQILTIKLLLMISIVFVFFGTPCIHAIFLNKTLSRRPAVKDNDWIIFLEYDALRAISKTRNTGTTEHRNTEHRNTGTASFRNTGTLKILNLLKIREKNTGGCESIAAIIIA